MKLTLTLLSIITATNNANVAMPVVISPDTPVCSLTYPRFFFIMSASLNMKVQRMEKLFYMMNPISKVHERLQLTPDDVCSFKNIVARHFYNSFIADPANLSANNPLRLYPQTLQGVHNALQCTNVFTFREIDLSNDADLYSYVDTNGRPPLYLSVLPMLRSLRFFNAMEVLSLNNMKITDEILQQILPDILRVKRVSLSGNLITQLPDFSLGLTFLNIPKEVIFTRNAIKIPFPGGVNGCIDISLKLDDNNFDEECKSILGSKFKSVDFIPRSINNSQPYGMIFGRESLIWFDESSSSKESHNHTDSSFLSILRNQSVTINNLD